VPIHIQIGSQIPKANTFGFKKNWLDFEGFHDTKSTYWNEAPYKIDYAQSLSGKFKCLIYILKKWNKNIFNLNKIIYNCSFTLTMLDGIEDQRPLSIIEKNSKTS
jgi:hypothetical protein